MPATLTNVRTLRVDGDFILVEPPSVDRVQRSLRRVLDETALCGWATVSAGGRAHIHTGYFAHADLCLYLLSHPGSLHSRNLAANASMAVAVFRSSQGWTEPGRGIQLFGTCAQVAGAAVADAERVYAERFPAYVDWKATLPPGAAAGDYRFFRFAAERIKLLDEAEFGDAVWVQADVNRLTGHP